MAFQAPTACKARWPSPRNGTKRSGTSARAAACTFCKAVAGDQRLDRRHVRLLQGNVPAVGAGLTSVQTLRSGSGVDHVTHVQDTPRRRKVLAEADKEKTIIQPRLFRVRRSPDAPTRPRLWGQSRPRNS